MNFVRKKMFNKMKYKKNTRMKYKKIKEELRKYIEEFESITSILTSDPFTQNIYIKLLMRWAIASKEKISHKIRLNSCIVLSHLTFPRLPLPSLFIYFINFKLSFIYHLLIIIIFLFISYNLFFYFLFLFFIYFIIRYRKRNNKRNKQKGRG